MDKGTIKKIVLQAIDISNQSRSPETQIATSESSILFGKDGSLDSMALVALLMDIEDALQEQNIDVSLSDEKAMSSTRSPFKDISSITQYVHNLTATQS